MFERFRYPELFTQRLKSVVVLLAWVLLDFGVFLVEAADSSSATITGTDAAGRTTILFVDRNPALYTGDFGDCMGGQSLINLTSFDAAYYADNQTVLFNMAGSTNLRNESLMLYISVQAYGEDRFNLVFNPCNANFLSLCPLNSSVPIRGQALIPVSKSDVSNIPSIALKIPDFEGSAILRIFSNTSQTQIGCFSATMRNGSSLSHPGLIGSCLALFTIVGILASFATTTWVADVAEKRTHYAHSLPVLVIFEVFHSVFFSGALSLNWPSILTAWWSNFALFSGMVYSHGIIKSLNSFVGISGNSSQVGGAGSTTLSNNGGLQQQIYGRSISMRAEDLTSNVNAVASYLNKRANSNEEDPRLYEWAGLPVSPGLPLPGNWSGFAGELSMIGIPAADAFLTGIIWLLILILIICFVLATLKYVLEGLCHVKLIRNDRLAFFRERWLKVLKQALFRIGFMSFFMIMTLALYQFSYGGKAKVISIAALVFSVTFGGFLAVNFYAYSCGKQLHCSELKNRQSSFQPPRTTKNLASSGASSINIFGKETGQPATSLKRAHDTEESVAIASTENEIQNLHNIMEFTERFGWLSAHFRSQRWWFFAVWAIYQFIRACLVGGARAHPIAQVSAVLAWELIAFIAMIIINPWEGTRNTVLAVWMLGISKVVTSGLSIAFLPQLQVARIPTTVIGIFIIITQGLLVISLLILIILGAISSYMSLSRDNEQFKPQKLQKIRLKYLAHVEHKTNDPPPPEAPKEPKEPYFSVNNVRRQPKIEDETPPPINGFYKSNPSYTSLSRHDPTVRSHSRVDSISESVQSHPSKYSNSVNGLIRKNCGSSVRDLDDTQMSPSSRAGTPISSIVSYNMTSGVPLIRPSTPITCLKPVMPSTEQQMLFASQRANNTS